MYHFLAILGRKPWARFVMPTVSMATSVGYLAPHYFGHSTVQKLFAAEKPDGGKEEITPELKQLIIDTFQDIKDDFNKSYIPAAEKYFFSSWKPIVKWFSTSSLLPQVFGMVETRNGVLIGLPYYYNYDKVTELPSHARQFKKFSLFKTFSSKDDKKKQEEKEQFKDELLKSEVFEDQAGESLYIDEREPEGRAYLDSLILSEKAKRFSIARELCYGDTYRVAAKSLVIFISVFLPVGISRTAVQKLKLSSSHISHRIPFYLLSSLLGMGHYIMLSDALHMYYEEQADKRALAVSNLYREGGVEYFEKLLQRNKALRYLSSDFKSLFDEKGNVIDSALRNRYTPLTERLKRAMEPAPEVEENQ